MNTHVRVQLSKAPRNTNRLHNTRVDQSVDMVALRIGQGHPYVDEAELGIILVVLLRLVESRLHPARIEIHWQWQYVAFWNKQCMVVGEVSMATTLI